MVSSEEIKRRLAAKRKGEQPYQEKPPAEGYVNCPECNTPNVEGAKFCVGCGASLVDSKPEQDTVICPQCQATNPADAKFCVGCGASLVTEEVADTQDEDQTSDFKLCPSCNQKNEINAKFCVICGHKFQESVNVDEAPAEPTEKVAAEPVEEVVSEPTPEVVEEIPETTDIPEIKVPKDLKLDTAEMEAEPVQDSAVDEETVQSEPAEIGETNQLDESDKENLDPVDKIKKAKDLLDIGAITQEEFEQIKNKYLERI
jgi:ribosomal protein L40E